MKTNERRWAILEKLCKERYSTRDNLAFEFGVSKRTIDYDLEILSLDYPIYTKNGNGGGVYIVDGFELERKYLSAMQEKFLSELMCRCSKSEKVILREILREFRYPQYREAL